MIIPQKLPKYLQRPLAAFLCPFQVSENFQDAAEVVDTDGDVGMVRSKSRFINGERPLEAFPCPFQVSESLQDGADVVDADGDFRMVRSKSPFTNGKRPLEAFPSPLSGLRGLSGRRRGC